MLVRKENIFAIINLESNKIILTKEGKKKSMKNGGVIPFRNMTSKGKLNIALVAIITCYLGFISIMVHSTHFCGYFGLDYCAYWSGGRIMNDKGLAEVYDIDLLFQYQAKIYPQAEDPSLIFKAMPLPYLPIFMLPFQVLALVNLKWSYLIWTLLNVLGYVVYLKFLITDLTKNNLPHKILLMIILSLPMFLNMRNGQLNIWLSICVGEFMRSLYHSKPIKAGFWLGGCMLKPQILIFIIPILLLRKSFKPFLGFVLSSSLAFLISYGLIGGDGFKALFQILINSSQGGAASNPQVMMNWRMLGVYFSEIFSSNVSWVVIITGSVIIFFVTLITFSKKPINNTFDYLAISLLGIFAATGAVTWHAHLSMSIVLIPMVLFLMETRRFSPKFFMGWIFLPAISYFMMYFLRILIQTNIIPVALNLPLDLLEGLPGFIFNLLFLGWAVRHYRSRELPTMDLSLFQDSI